MKARLTDPSKKPIRDLIEAFEAELAKRTTIEEIDYDDDYEIDYDDEL